MLRSLENFCFQCPADSGIISHLNSRLLVATPSDKVDCFMRPRANVIEQIPNDNLYWILGGIPHSKRQLKPVLN